jgi:hypothetical protein
MANNTTDAKIAGVVSRTNNEDVPPDVETYQQTTISRSKVSHRTTLYRSERWIIVPPAGVDYRQIDKTE